MRIINPNLKQLVTSYKDPEVNGCVLEGGSRSGKTWSSIDFLIWLCSKHETKSTIHIVKETYNSFKTTIFDDLKRRLPMYGIIDSPFGRIENISRYNLFGNEIHFLGADSSSTALGSGCDYLWANETLDIAKTVLDQKEMRCRKFWWYDYNPKELEHHIYTMADNRKDVNFLLTTMLDNPHITKNEKRKILGYEATEQNIKEGTADAYLWNVYGRGERTQLEGAVFINWESITEIPKDAKLLGYGLDFGYTNDPTTLSALYLYNNEIYTKELIYETGLTNPDIARKLIALEIDKSIPIYADSAEPKSIQEIYEFGFNIMPVKKGADSIKFGIDVMKQYKINITADSINGIKELRNYKWLQDKEGKSLNKPVDSFNHFLDALRYSVMMLLSKQDETTPTEIRFM